MVIYLIINKQKRIEFINDCDCNVNYAELEEAILWYSEKPTARLKHIYMFGNYPAVSIYKEKLHVHRLLMMYWLECKIPRDYFVHHIDEDKLNATKENLSVVWSSSHQSHHNKGKRLTDEHRRKIALKNSNRRGAKQKKHRQDVDVKTVIKLKEKGLSINKIAIKMNCDWSTIKARIDEHDDPELLEVEE